MTRQRWMLALTAAVTVAGAEAQAQGFISQFFTEDFEGVTLGDSVNERLGLAFVTRVASDPDSTAVADAFSTTGPAGWAVDNGLGTLDGAPTIGNTGVPGQGVADYGVDEWEGWTFADKTFWSDAAGGQDRELFNSASGTVAVVDPDEYFDLDPLDGETSGPGNPNNGGFYNSSLSTPSVGINGLGTTSIGVQISFDSSYRLEATDDDHPDPAFTDLNNSTGEVVVVFDTGEVQSQKVFDSIADTDDAVDARQELSFFPAQPGATSAQYFFNFGNAGNDWWWAIDNVEVADVDINTGLPLAPSFTEDFEGVALGESVNERQAFTGVTTESGTPDTTAVEDVWTNTAPAGWNRDNSATPADGLGDDDVGVYEWEGWSFADKDFWSDVAGQGRETFDKGQGNVAVADGDEWDDLGNPEQFGELNTLLETPAIDVSGVGDDELLLIAFDSSWRAEDAQTAILTVDFGSGPTEILRWESDDASAFFHDDNTDETVFVRVDPNGAPTATFSFRYIGTDDWWWAIDNVRVGSIPEPSSIVLLGSVALTALGIRRRG